MPNAGIMGGGLGTFYVDDLEIEFYSPTSVSSIKKDGKIILYPNPTHGQVTIECAENAELFMVRSLTGSVILNEKMENLNHTFSLVGLPKGIYIVEVVFKDGGRYSEKFVLQ